jgi:hypothetical protein
MNDVWPPHRVLRDRLAPWAEDRALDVKVFAGSAAGRAFHALAAFHAAIAGAGDRVTLVEGDSPYAACDVAVLFGLPKADRGPNDRQRPNTSRRVRRRIHAAHRGPLIVLESGLLGRAVELRRRPIGEIARRWLRGHFHGAYERINRDDYFRVAIGGAGFDDGDFCNAASPPDRWRQISASRGLGLAPWRTTGRHVLVVGQVPGDAALRGLDIMGWIERTVLALARHTTRPIVVRPHPMTPDGDLAELARLPLIRGRATLQNPPLGPIAGSLAGAWATVCHSSGTAIDSLLAGVPAITTSEASMAWPVTGHDLAEIERPPMPPREQWLYDLCYGQWTLEEIRSGQVWGRLRPRLLQRLAAAA